MQGRTVVERDHALLGQLVNKWSLLVLDALCDSPRRFNELRRELAPVTSKALSETLRRLEHHGIVERRVLSGHPVAVEYRITADGYGLEQPLRALLAWLAAQSARIEAERSGSKRGQAGMGGSEETVPAGGSTNTRPAAR